MESQNNLLQNEYKVYISALELRQEDGTILPRVIIWEDGTKYEIDRVLDIRPAASLRGGGAGLRYTVRIEDTVTYLWLEENRWFVERRRAKGSPSAG